MIVRGIDNLNYHTPRALRILWQRHKREITIPDEITTTVYHLGFSEDTGVVHSYAYRSTNDFSSERLEPYGLRYKPECQVPANYHLPADFIAIMNEQRAAQAVIPKEQQKDTPHEHSRADPHLSAVRVSPGITSPKFIVSAERS